jgi:hypothetical protein
MPVLTFPNVIVTAAIVLQAALAATMLRRGLARAYPVFLLYLCLNLIEDPSGLLLSSHTPAIYRHFYFVVTVLDYVLQLFVLWEIATNVFQRDKGLIPLPLARLATLGVLTSLLVALSFSPGIGVLASVNSVVVLFRITLVLAVLKILLFAALAAFAQLLGISWKNHVLQLASGFAFYGAASLLVQLSISHTPAGGQYAPHLFALNEVQSGAYLTTLLFWIWAFSRNEAPRKDFTPQMQEVLVTIAQSAKRTRLAVTRGSDRG